MDTLLPQAENTPRMRRSKLLRLFNLRNGQAEFVDIDAAIRGNTQLAGTNLWVLMFAIVIASVGLNVNSTAVIIGAMLISPLMGPIIGIGYGTAIADYALIRQCFKNLGIFVGISLIASTTYFALTPLTGAHSELLARTSPTIWDVLIAFFGGAAGMIGLTRKEKTTLIPGVAIATALMPPLCTAGYGLATWQIEFFFGAFFLFLINGVFIALSTLAISRILRVPQHTFPDEATRQRERLIIGSAVMLTLLPSIYLAYQLVHQEIFTAGAEKFIQANLMNRDDVTLVSRSIDPKARLIRVVLIGREIDPQLESKLNKRLRSEGLADASLVIRHPSEAKLDVGKLKDQLQRELALNANEAAQRNAEKIANLESTVARYQKNLSGLALLENEIHAQLPGLKRVIVTGKLSEESGKFEMLLALDSHTKLASGEIERLKRWLKVRFPDTEIHVIVGRIMQ